MSWHCIIGENVPKVSREEERTGSFCSLWLSYKQWGSSCGTVLWINQENKAFFKSLQSEESSVLRLLSCARSTIIERERESIKGSLVTVVVKLNLKRWMEWEGQTWPRLSIHTSCSYSSLLQGALLCIAQHSMIYSYINGVISPIKFKAVHC